MENLNLKVFSANANLDLAEKIADYLGVSLGKCSIDRFSDGEINLAINESVRGVDAYIVQPTCAPVHENLMELLIMIDAMKRASARRITAVMPYYGYARQERKSKPRDPISAKMVANILTAAGADRVVTIDLHASAIQGFFDIPVDHLPAASILSNYIKKKNLEDFVIASPDVGGVVRAKDMADRLGTEFVIINKVRPRPNEAKIMNIIGDVKDKTVVMVDDLIDTGGTITKGAQALVDNGAKEVYVCCTHPVFSGPAMKRIEDSVIKEMIITDTIPLTEEKASQCTKIKVVSVATLLGDAIMRINKNLSVSRLFD